jgi:hypothetical protein
MVFIPFPDEKYRMNFGDFQAATEKPLLKETGGAPFASRGR